MKKIEIQDGCNFFNFHSIVNLQDSRVDTRKSNEKATEIPGPNFPTNTILPIISKMSESEKADLTIRLMKGAESTRRQTLEKLGWSKIEDNENKMHVNETAQELVNTMTESKQERTNLVEKTEMMIDIERARQLSIQQTEESDKIAVNKRRLNEQLIINRRKRKNTDSTINTNTGSFFEDLVILESGNLNKAVGSMLVGPSHSHKNEKYFKRVNVDEACEMNTWRENTGFNMPKPNMPPSGFNLPKPNIPMRKKDIDDGPVMIHANIPPAMPKPNFESSSRVGSTQNQIIQTSLPPPNMPTDSIYFNSHTDNTRNNQSNDVNFRLKLW